MPKLTTRQRAERVLHFLLGLRDPRAVAALRAHGFGAADVDEAWSLLRGVAPVPLDAEPFPEPEAHVDALRLWRDQWQEVVHASLARRYPAVAAEVFAGLAADLARDPRIGVGVLLDALDGLRGRGGDAEGALAIAASRGLDEAERARGRELLLRARALPDGPFPVPFGGVPPAQLEAAEEALWSWYLEWSAIARRAIRSRQVLRGLGFLQDGDGGGAAQEG